MKVERGKFLELTFLLAAACTESKPATTPEAPSPSLFVPPVQPPAPVATPEPVDASVAPPVAPVASVSLADGGACSNAVGTLAACARIGPSCEGMGQECRDLTEHFVPRVAEKWAACFAAAKAPRCRDKKLGACMREAVMSACDEPWAEPLCQDFMTRCQAAKSPPKYTLAQCVKVLSAAGAQPGSRDWMNANLDLLGPTTERGSCGLDWVLPYQPWGWSWK